MNLIRGKKTSKSQNPHSSKDIFDNPKAVKVNDDVIIDNYTVQKDKDATFTARTLDMLCDAITEGNFQRASLDVPLDCRFVGPDSLSERTMCLCIGKLEFIERVMFIWVYRSFRNEWCVGASLETAPEQMIQSTTIPLSEGLRASRQHPRTEALPRSYAAKLEQFYYRIKRQARAEYQAEAIAKSSIED